MVIWKWDIKGEAFGTTAPDQDPDQDGTTFVFDMRFPGQRYDALSEKRTRVNICLKCIFPRAPFDPSVKDAGKKWTGGEYLFEADISSGTLLCRSHGACPSR
jgi:hypothetical protein